eukprot:jgi/Hompol1/1094/HPOL_005533-RA
MTTSESEPINECCLQGYLWNGTPHGSETALGSVAAYVALPAATKRSNTAIIIIHDIFGWQLVNNRLIADRLAALSGIPVYLPDFFNGESIGLPGGARRPDAQQFLERYGPEATAKRIDEIVAVLAAQGKTEL